MGAGACGRAPVEVVPAVGVDGLSLEQRLAELGDLVAVGSIGLVLSSAHVWAAPSARRARESVLWGRPDAMPAHAMGGSADLIGGSADPMGGSIGGSWVAAAPHEVAAAHGVAEYHGVVSATWVP